MRRSGFLSSGQTPQAKIMGGGDQAAITPRSGGKVKPSIKEVSIGISPYGEVVNLPIWERHCLIAGQSGSGKSWVANRMLAEIFRIPKEERLVAIIDCKGAVEGAKWARVADAVAGTIDEADVILTNVDAEMKRREALIKSDISEFWDSRIKPNRDTPLIVIYIDELAVLGNPIKEDKDAEAVRKHAMFMLNELLFRARSSAICVICAIQRPDASLFGGGAMRNNLQNRLCGRVDTSSSSDVVFGMGMAQEGLDASKLTHHWFIAQIEGKGTFRFKTPGEFDDSDLRAVALNPAFYADPERGRWLTADPESPEAIPWYWQERKKENRRRNAEARARAQSAYSQRRGQSGSPSSSPSSNQSGDESYSRSEGQQPGYQRTQPPTRLQQDMSVDDLPDLSWDDLMSATRGGRNSGQNRGQNSRPTPGQNDRTYDRTYDRPNDISNNRPTPRQQRDGDYSDLVDIPPEQLADLLRGVAMGDDGQNGGQNGGQNDRPNDRPTPGQQGRQPVIENRRRVAMPVATIPYEPEDESDDPLSESDWAGLPNDLKASFEEIDDVPTTTPEPEPEPEKKNEKKNPGTGETVSRPRKSRDEKSSNGDGAMPEIKRRVREKIPSSSVVGQSGVFPIFKA